MRYIISIILSLAIGLAYANTTQTIYPQKLKIGDTVALISSASYAPTEQDIAFSKKRIEQLGLRVIEGKTIHNHYGYFSGTIKQRADDINHMFANPEVKAIFEVRGGWGSAELLNQLDYPLIQKHPKIFIGLSDITSLLNAIHKKTGLVTFHGPLGIEPWPQFSVDYLKKALFSSKTVSYTNPKKAPDLNKDIIQTQHVTQTIQPGSASGQLVGGNLSVLVTLLGTPYEPDWENKILFVEDVGENNYQIDRMLSQLNNAGVFNKINGFIFGECTRCVISNNALGSFSLFEIISKYTKPHHIPAYMGATIGHDPENFTLPIGVLATMDATKGQITLQHAGVK